MSAFGEREAVWFATVLVLLNTRCGKSERPWRTAAPGNRRRLHPNSAVDHDGPNSFEAGDVDDSIDLVAGGLAR